MSSTSLELQADLGWEQGGRRIAGWKMLWASWTYDMTWHVCFVKSGSQMSSSLCGLQALKIDNLLICSCLAEMRTVFAVSEYDVWQNHAWLVASHFLVWWRRAVGYDNEQVNWHWFWYRRNPHRKIAATGPKLHVLILFFMSCIIHSSTNSLNCEQCTTDSFVSLGAAANMVIWDWLTSWGPLSPTNVLSELGPLSKTQLNI